MTDWLRPQDVRVGDVVCFNRKPYVPMTVVIKSDSHIHLEIDRPRAKRMFTNKEFLEAGYIRLPKD